jgi:alpha-tubulin suppressor-like RCC1 family protein
VFVDLNGQLGDVTTMDRLVPTPVAGSLTFAALSAGTGNGVSTTHTCGVTASGAAYCWGANREGQLGDGTHTERLVPTAVGAPQVALLDVLKP